MLIFVINLKKSIDRKKSMEEKIKNLAKRTHYEIYLESHLLDSKAESLRDKAEVIYFDSKDSINGLPRHINVARNDENAVPPLSRNDENTTLPRHINEARNDEKITPSLSHNDKNSVQLSRNDEKNTPLSRNSQRFYFHFFEAVDAKDIESKKIKINHYSAILSKFVRGKELSFGELACFASHYALWEKCVALGENIIILEDDMSFRDDFLDSIINIQDSRFEYVRLYYLFDRKIRHLSDRFYISYANLSGTQGYFLSPNAAKRFILHSKIWFHCIDNYMDMFFINKNPNIIYKPFCVYEDDVYAKDSTIKGREKVKIKWQYNLMREISRIVLFGVYRNLYIFFCKIKGI